MEPSHLGGFMFDYPKSADTRGPDTQREDAAPGARSARPALRGLDYDAQVAALRPVQRSGAGGQPGVHEAAAAGVAGSGSRLPHADAIQAAFGPYDVGGISAHTGAAASQASRAMGAQAYATGTHVAFDGAPDLHTTAHEAAHVIQQQHGVQLKGGVGAAGDVYERNADAVADRVVAGQSAVDLLDEVAGGGGSSSGAVQQLSSSRSGPVQMYSKVQAGPIGGDACRVANDGEMVVLDSDVFPEGDRSLQVAYASPGVIQASAAELARVGSGYELSVGGGAINVDAPDGSGTKALQQVTATNLVNQTQGPAMTTAQNCNANMGVAMGLTQVDGGADRLNMEAQMGMRHTIRHGEDRDVTNTYSSKTYDDSAKDARALMTGKSRDKADSAYASLGEDKRTKRGAYSHVNSGAKAGVGGGYGVYSQEGGDHFTPIVAASGGDELALEVHAQADRNKNNFDNWYFRMYGSEQGQSYYEEYRDAREADPAATDRAAQYLGRSRDAGPDGPQRTLTVVAFRKVVSDPADATEANEARATYFASQSESIAGFATNAEEYARAAHAKVANSGGRLRNYGARLGAVRAIQTTNQLKSAHTLMCTVRDEILGLGDTAVSRETWLLNKLLSAIDAAGQRVLEVERLDAWLANQA